MCRPQQNVFVPATGRTRVRRYVLGVGADGRQIGDMAVSNSQSWAFESVVFDCMERTCVVPSGAICVVVGLVGR